MSIPSITMLPAMLTGLLPLDVNERMATSIQSGKFADEVREAAAHCEHTYAKNNPKGVAVPRRDLKELLVLAEKYGTPLFRLRGVHMVNSN